MKVQGSTSQFVLFLCGDVMTGRGIDQILPYPSNPILHERFMENALGYVELAESINGDIQRPKNFHYLWGKALRILERENPDLRIINLETAITTSNDWENKGINYRMSPKNISCLTIPNIDCCTLANNHILDWGYAGLKETLQTLRHSKIHSTGAGNNLEEASKPATLSVPNKARVLVFSFGLDSSGIPKSWSAQINKPGVNFIDSLDYEAIENLRKKIEKIKLSNDIVVASIHWGGNWGYEISEAEKWFAQALIDRAHVDLVHGHSSHHAKGIEVYKNKLILYGCGDFINDYEGITGYENFRSDLSLMYFPQIDLYTGQLVTLKIVPLQIKKFCLHLAHHQDVLWLKNMLNREGRTLGTHFECREDNSLILSTI